MLNENQTMGVRIISWKGDNNNGEFVTSGVYIYTLKANGTEVSKKMILIK